ncbi:MAG: response regulator [Synechococcaceae cyanobacterium SM2_3_2]|nr:response regulator [Synechococcaceae cyanobacterium SM2_3_2]
MHTILVVDDSKTDLQVIAEPLHQVGYRVVTSSSEQEALQQIQQLKLDLILLDVVLPNRRSFEICRELKERPDTQSTQWYFVLAKGNKMDKFWGMQQGADGYLAKSVDSVALLAEVARLLTVTNK